MRFAACIICPERRLSEVGFDQLKHHSCFAPVSTRRGREWVESGARVIEGVISSAGREGAIAPHYRPHWSVGAGEREARAGRSIGAGEGVREQGVRRTRVS